ncbi:amidohydrolase family protein [Candidatus Poriferisocius sp.]|uniref:amidohydrolase family protein n=1 Tax=Candidatus Poriferisocius sp. TaxID=3101276 RepID=UPI003B5A5EC8
MDDHIIEPPHVWTDRIPAKYQDECPRVVTRDDGTEMWQYEGEQLATMGLNAVAGKAHKDFAMDPASYGDMIEGCFNPVTRAQDLLQDGIRGSLCFPTFPRFAGQRFLTAKDKTLADLCVRAYNDWMLEEWCDAVPGLYIPMMIGQLWDPELMAAEIRRNAERGVRSVSFPESTAPFDEPSFHTTHWDPVWQACVDTDMVVSIHIGTSGRTLMPSDDASFSVAVALGPVNAQITFMDILLCGIFQRFPDLKVALSEGGIGWVPFALERIDRTWERHRYWADLDDTPPSEIFRRNVWVCFIDEQAGVEARDHIGGDKIMWECDYPHADTPWPNSQGELRKLLSDLPADDVAAMTHGNAERLYRWRERPDVEAILGSDVTG